jgi:hypothetical protein
MEHREVNAAFALPFIILRTRLHSERRKWSSCLSPLSMQFHHN